MQNYFKIGATVLSISLASCASQSQDSIIEREISTGWQYHQVSGDYTGDATVPGTIHTDLLKQGAIEDPFYRTNEKDQQWIDKEDWIYSTELYLTEQEIKKETVELHFAGLDTYADVYLNNNQILEADNMFREWTVNIKPFAQQGKNELKAYFHSPIKKGLIDFEQAEYTYPANNDQSENGGLGDKKVSIFTRKAGYHYGWDWGPRFVTSGIWRPITLRSYNTGRISNVFIAQEKVTKELAKVTAKVEIESLVDANATLIINNKEDKTLFVEKKVQITKGTNSLALPFDIENPNLWWSVGLGDPNLYTFETKLLIDNKTISTSEDRTGLRSLKLIRDKDAAGKSFMFELNGVRLFAKGANYIPNDNFLPRVTDADYKKVIADAVDANMNMLRVWGGGIYENKIFYDLCDENGLLVWQDFMFACSMYPGDQRFLDNVKHEAIDNVKRLRNHPSIAVWCGNNEMNVAWHYFGEGGWGWKDKYTQEQKDKIQKAYMDIFHTILPEAISTYTDGDAYWPSSPQAGYEAPKHAAYDNTAGDMHYWGVWHGLHKFEDFDKYKARFMSEYGFQSFPDFETVKTYTTPEDYDIESEVMAAHQRSGIGNLRIREYMEWDYKVPTDFEDFLYMSHVLQAKGMKMGIEAHRRAMPYCMGSLFWQINDCWPVASWSSTDYYHKWKAMHFAVRRALEPQMLSTQIVDNKMKVYGVSDKLKDIKGELVVETIGFGGQKIASFTQPASLKANSSTLLLEKEINKKQFGNIDPKTTFVNLIFKNAEGKVVTENKMYLCKPKEMKLEKPKLSFTLEKEEKGLFVTVTTDKLVKDLYLKVKGKDIRFQDNYFDALPGHTYKIEIKGKDKADFDLSMLKTKHLQEVAAKI